MQFFNRLSPERRAFLSEAIIDTTARLDYPKAEIQMTANTYALYKRAKKSCAKEPGTIEWLEKYVRPGEVLFDIGANVGAYSLVAATKGKKTRVYAFEPGFSTYVELCRNILLNGFQERITPLNIPLSNKTIATTFRYRTIASGAAEHEGLDKTVSSKKAPAFTQPVICYALDEVVRQFKLPTPNHIKLDVDGVELAVLQGAKKVLADMRLRTIQVELKRSTVEGQRVLKLIKQSGFSVVKSNVHKNAVTTDVLFERS